LANLDLVRDSRDQEILETAGRGLLGGTMRNHAVPTDELTPWGAALYALLMNEDPERVGPLIAHLDPRVRERIAFLSPSRVIDRLRSHLIIIHGREDDYIPYTESLRLAAAAPIQERVHLAITRLILHVDVAESGLNSRDGIGGFLRDLWGLARVVRFAVAQRHGA
jgi:hypothetical protein